MVQVAGLGTYIMFLSFALPSVIFMVKERSENLTSGSLLTHKQRVQYCPYSESKLVIFPSLPLLLLFSLSQISFKR